MPATYSRSKTFTLGLAIETYLSWEKNAVAKPPFFLTVQNIFTFTIFSVNTMKRYSGSQRLCLVIVGDHLSWAADSSQSLFDHR